MNCSSQQPLPLHPHPLGPLWCVLNVAAFYEYQIHGKEVYWTSIEWLVEYVTNTVYFLNCHHSFITSLLFLFSLTQRLEKEILKIFLKDSLEA